MKLTPAPRACSTIRRASARSVWSANIIVPRQSAETLRGLRPRLRYCMFEAFAARAHRRGAMPCVLCRIARTPHAGLTSPRFRFNNGMVAPLKSRCQFHPTLAGTPMNLTEEQLAFRDSIRRMVERHVAPIAAEIDETDRFPTELLPIYGDMGLMQLWVPEKYGGPEGNLTLMCIAREEISRHLAGLRLDRRPEHDVHHAAAALRHRGAAAALPAEDRRRRRGHGDRHLRAAGRLGRQRDADPGGEGRRLLRHQRPQAMVQLRRRGRVHRPHGAHRAASVAPPASAPSCSSRRR